MPADVSDRARREAAQWYAELSDETADAALWLRFLIWERRPEHAAAFQEIEAALSVLDRAPATDLRPPRQPRRTFLLAGLAATLLLGAVGAVTLLGEPPAQPVAPEIQTYATAIGQQETISLADGSTATLNTASRIEVSYSPGARQIELLAGQVLFDVHREARPFIVAAGGTETRAIGTSFEVYLPPGGVQVTLLEGLVSVGGAAGDRILSPGERINMEAGAVTVTRIDPARAVSWKSGMIPLTDVTLAEAAAELNRYSGVRLEIDPAIASERLSGSFRAGDQEGFAAVLEDFLAVRADRQDGVILIRPAHPE